MKILKGMKFRLEPSSEQRSDMTMYAGHNRAVWNKALALAKDRLDRKEPILWYHELNWQMTTIWKMSEEMSWLNEAPSQTLQQTLKQFDRAMRDCFDKSQPNKCMPRFKKIKFLGSQGDIWDAQKDMLADTLGAITSLVAYWVIRPDLKTGKHLTRNRTRHG